MKLKNSMDETAKLIYEKLKGTKREWRQRGSYIVCTNGPIEYGFHVPPYIQLCGVDAEDNPKFKNLQTGNSVDGSTVTSL